MEERDEFQELQYDIKVVTAARFAMAKRLQFAAFTKAFLINGVTAISIFISAGLLVADDGKFPVDLVAVALVGIAIFTMWMNLDQSAHEINSKADRVRQCAVQLNQILKNIQHKKLSEENALQAYQDVLSAHPDNHHDVDRNYAIYTLKDKFEKAKDAHRKSSVPCYFSMFLWYPAVFIAWFFVVYLISQQIVS
ncbi:MAG: SLATT domain-containing protein [Hyphomicrobiales bacterium]